MSFSWAKPYEPKHPLMRWFDERLPLPRLIYGAVGGGYPVPRNLNYFWNFGVLAGIFLTIQIVTGIVLAMHYTPSVDGAFDSVDQADHARRQRRLAAALYAYDRRELLLPRHLHPHLPRALLRILQGAARAGVDARAGHLSVDDGDGVHGLRAAVGADELLGRAGHHRLLLGLSAGRRADPALAARRLRARPGGADPLLLAPLSAAVRDRCRGDPPHLGAAHPGIGQPDRSGRQGRARHVCRSIRSTRRRTAGSRVSFC